VSAAIVLDRSAPLADQAQSALESVLVIAQLADDGRITLTPGIRAGLHAAVETLSSAMVAAVMAEFDT
jgi:hypothetical protein